MKSFCIAFVLILLFISCKKDSAPVSSTAYPSIAVGIEKNSAFKVINSDILKKEWEKQLAIAGEARKISDFKISQGTATGDAHANYYLLTATCTDHKTTMAALLELKQNNFYFIPDIASVICSGGCGHGCEPSVLSKSNMLYIICSECADCVKTDFFLNFP